MTSSSVDRRTSRRGRGPALAAAATGLALLTAQAPPILDLRAAPAPPPLGESSYTDHLRATLEEEILVLYQNERSAEEPRRGSLRAGINYRIMAAELLAQGGAAGDAGWCSALIGLRLAHGRSYVDAALAPDTGGSDVRGADVAAVQRFNEDTIDLAHRLRTTDPTELDASVARIMWSLARALHPALEVDPVSHWPAGSGGAGAAPARPLATLEEIGTRLETTTLQSRTRDLVTEILGFLRRGALFADMRPEVDVLRDRLTELLDSVDVVAAATWMSDDDKARYLDAAHDVAVMLRDPSRRDDGARRLGALGATGVFIGRLNTLRDLRGDPRPFAAALRGGEDEAVRRDRLGVILDRMIRYRRLAPVKLPRDLKVAMGKLGQAYEAAESAVVDHLDAIAGGEALSDPAVSSLVADQAQYVDDIGRLARAGDWIDAVEALDARAAPGFQRQLRKMSRWLLDSNRRPDAVMAMDQFEAQLVMISPLEFEDELKARSRAAIIASGGLDEALLAHVGETRRAWARAWGRGDAGSEAAARLVLVSRLTRSMAGCAEVLDPADGPVRLDRWAAWEMPRAMIARGSAELPNRLKLATAAAIEGNDGQVAAQLERLDRDAPLAGVIGRLSTALDEALAPLPDGLAGLLGQVLYPPRDDAWMLEARPALARLCRYAMEADHAWSEGREEDGAALQAFVNAQAGAPLRQLDAREGAPLEVRGFDGSDPEGDQ